MGRNFAKFHDLVEIITRLRQPDGCPWDRKQTVESFRPYLLEEMHELFEALDNDDHHHIKEELGDLLFQILFLGNLYEERKSFTLEEVIETISAKMIRRHPHVFGDKKFSSEKEMRLNWNKIKENEKTETGRKEREIFRFPKSLPALSKAQKVSGRAVLSGFEWPDMAGVVAKLDEEVEELKEALASGDRERIEDELGDLFFTMVNVSRKAGLEAETTLQRATQKFIRRFTRMAELAGEKKSPLEELDIGAMQELWIKVKEEEQT